MGLFRRRSKVSKQSEDSSEGLKDQKNHVPRSWFQHLTSGLSKTRRHFSDRLARLFLGKKQIDAVLLEEIETILLSADVGVSATEEIIEHLTDAVSRKALSDIEALSMMLKTKLIGLLKPCEKPLEMDAHTPHVILMVGVNGNGKTTSIGKLAHHFQKQGRSVLLGAGDTFRAAAIDQLNVWGARNDIPVIAQQPGADSASVIYDAFSAAKARGIDVLIADTAGRLHTQGHLMAELEKIKRVLQKIDGAAPHDILLVLDAGTGQNALTQTQRFDESMGLTGVILTKLDGTAKGGIIFSIAKQFELPIPFIGVGEGIEDLQPFEAEYFVEALFKQDHE